jgi:succinyl-diaminopimelate desuccinylase
MEPALDTFGDLDGFLDLACELLAVPSTADRPHDLTRAMELVLDAVGPGFTVEQFTSNGKPSALVYCGASRPRFRVILNGHLDVVPADPDQFVPRVGDGRLVARGAQDMKVSALAMALAFRDLAPRLPFALGLQLVTDEEVGGYDGTRHQVRQGVRGDFVIIGEYTRLDIVADSKGLLHARLHAVGRAGHGAYPWLGDNALLAVVEGINRLLARYPVPSAEEWRTTVNLARIESPNAAVNQIPATATAWIDLRFPAEDADLSGRTQSEVTSHLQAVCGPGVRVEVDRYEPAHHADHDHPDVARLRQAAQAEGYAGALLRKHGSGDGRFYYQDGVPAVAFGVGGSGQHGPDEYAEIATFAPYHRALCRFLLDVAGTAQVTKSCD